ncbi:hypothetical protein LIER_29046 [Lithospermum erythrorhizon]|uniref:Uncharacterized protein n=1 Tax=Lithospermum erythrorhizon TaxID=34254 RepID=A0AAV3RM14_LITER
MMRYHGKGREKVYVLSEARTVLRSCPVTWKATRLDRDQPFFNDDHAKQSPLDLVLFVSLRTGRVCHRHGKAKSFPASVHPSTLVFHSFRSSKRMRSSSSTVEDRDLKHARGTRKATSSSRGSRVVSPVCRSHVGIIPSVVLDDVIKDQIAEVSSSVNGQEHTEFVDTGESSEGLAIEVAESCPPSLSKLCTRCRGHSSYSLKCFISI